MIFPHSLSPHDILKAVSTIGRYLDTKNDPTARKLEALFESLNMQLRLEETENIRDTALTDYFDRS